MKPREFKCWMRSAPGADDYSMFVNEQPNGGFKWEFWDFEMPAEMFKPIYISLEPREVLPDEISDSQRLDWLIENSAMVSNHDNGYWCEVKTNSKCRGYFETTPRQAIDAAMKEGK